jgi:uncharacterized membrane protein YeaQ/YmgE (transglycosylase-associated protein family)
MILVGILVLVALFAVLWVVGIALWLVLSAVVVGLIIGGLGRLVVPGSQPIGFLATVLAGLCGSVFGGLIGRHVLHTGRLLTVLIEVGISAVVVMIMAGSSRRNALR